MLKEGYSDGEFQTRYGNSPTSTPVYPVNESTSFVGSILGSANKSALGKTMQSQSVNFGTLIGNRIHENRMNTNRSTMSGNDLRKKKFYASKLAYILL